ncbi:carcinoembryonic antigen-related cell adhesion molecule [Pristimantis euphronides]
MSSSLLVLLGLAVDGTSGRSSIQLIPQYPVISGSVTLSVTGITDTNKLIIWYKGPNTDPQYQILTYLSGFGNLSSPGRLYNDRFSAFINGSLQIKDLRITDRGKYIVKIQTAKEAQDIDVTLTVYEPVTKPSITASIAQPKENDTFTLTCNTEKATTITWKKYRTHISSDKTVTFSSIKRDDSGEYQCEAQNLVSKESSDLFKVSVAYGPVKPRIQGELLVGVGFPITLLCSADSVPTPAYQWKFNEKVLKQNTSKYDISNVTMDNQGLYTCMLKNSVTGLTAIASVYVNVITEMLPENNSSVGLGLGLAFGLIVGVVLIIFGSFYLRRKFATKRLNDKKNESSQNKQDTVYENVKDTQRKEESAYMDLQFKTEDVYTELRK